MPSINQKIAVAVIGVVAVAVGLFVLSNRRQGNTRPAIATNHIGAADSTEKVVAPTPPQPAPQAIVEPDMEPGPASVPLSGQPKTEVKDALKVSWYALAAVDKERPGESPSNFKLRGLMVQKFHDFVADAEVTEAQEAKIMAILADLQAEYIQLDNALLGATADEDVEAVRTLSLETVERLRTVLSEKQMDRLDDYLGLSTLWNFVMPKPFDLKTEPASK